MRVHHRWFAFFYFVVSFLLVDGGHERMNHGSPPHFTKKFGHRGSRFFFCVPLSDTSAVLFSTFLPACVHSFSPERHSFTHTRNEASQ